jgi:hypothetical protein
LSAQINNHYQQEINNENHHKLSDQESSEIKSNIDCNNNESLSSTSSNMNAQEYLLSWCKENLRGYDSLYNRCKDFGASWRDGRAFLAILNRHSPNKIDFNHSLQKTNHANLKIAFDFAEAEFGVNKILEPEDVDTDRPDEKSIMTYVSMLCSQLPNVIPPHPNQTKLDTQKQKLINEFSMLSRSIMRWLRDSISTMDNRNVPCNLKEIRDLLNDVKSFRLDKYALKLKEKKRLMHLCKEILELNSIHNNNEEDVGSELNDLNVENELRSIEKVWQKFDNYIQLRENLLEKSCKKYEKLEVVCQKIDKSLDTTQTELNNLKKELNSNHNNSNKLKIKSYDQTLSQTEYDLNKILNSECEQLKCEENPQFDNYAHKIRQMINEAQELRSRLNLNTKETKKLENTNVKSGGGLNLEWLVKKREQIDDKLNVFPTDLNQLENELQNLHEIQQECETYHCLKSLEENETPLNEDKYNRTQFEIDYNLLLV